MPLPPLISPWKFPFFVASVSTIVRAWMSRLRLLVANIYDKYCWEISCCRLIQLSYILALTPNMVKLLISFCKYYAIRRQEMKIEKLHFMFFTFNFMFVMRMIVFFGSMIVFFISIIVFFMSLNVFFLCMNVFFMIVNVFSMIMIVFFMCIIMYVCANVVICKCWL